MKMNEENYDQKIRGIYKKAQAPEIVKSRTEETLNFLKQQNSVNTTLKRHRRRRPLSFRRAAAIAAAAIMCIGGTVFAAERLYQMYLKKEDTYQRSLHISTKEKLPKKIAEVKMEVNYIPEGFAQDSEKGMEHYYKNTDKEDAGYFILEPILMDSSDTLTESFVKDAQSLTINGHDAVYLCSSYTEDQTWENGVIYILYKDTNRIVSVNSWGHAKKEELIKIAENITLTPTGRMVSSKDLPHWSETIALEKQPDEKSDDTSTEDPYHFYEASERQMANVHQVGSKFNVESSLDDDVITEIQLEASVKDVQVADDFSLLAKEQEIPDDWKELTGPDGKLTSDTLIYNKRGNGADTMPEVVRKEETSLKLVYVTVEYTNTSNKTIRDAWYMASLIPITKKGDTYKVFTRIDDSCDYVENEHIAVGSELMYSDVSGGHRNNNYIPEIKPGKTTTVHMAWIVNEDELDKLYLDFCGEYPLTKESLETGLVDLNL